MIVMACYRRFGHDNVGEMIMENDLYPQNYIV